MCVGQKQRSICFWLPFSLFLSFGQTKERKELRVISTFKRNSFFSFSLDGKRNKKIKAKPNAPPVLPARPHEEYINCNFPLLLDLQDEDFVSCLNENTKGAVSRFTFSIYEISFNMTSGQGAIPLHYK